MKILRIIICLQAMLWIAGCTPPVVKDATKTAINWKEYQQTLGKIQHWEIAGRIAVQTADNGGQADYTWKQKNLSHYDIRLQAPLGAGTTWIEARAHGVRLRSSSGDQLVDSNVDNLMHRLNGWPLPVSGLRYWVRGLPSPGSEHKITEWNDNGLPAVIMQDGWRVELRKHKMVSGQLLPGKLFINRQGEEEVDVRLIIRQWNIERV